MTRNFWDMLMSSGVQWFFCAFEKSRQALEEDLAAQRLDLEQRNEAFVAQRSALDDREQALTEKDNQLQLRDQHAQKDHRRDHVGRVKTDVVTAVLSVVV